MMAETDKTLSAVRKESKANDKLAQDRLDEQAAAAQTLAEPDSTMHSPALVRPAPPADPAFEPPAPLAPSTAPASTAE